MAPDDNTPYVMSVRTTIRRKIWIPGINLMIVQALLHVSMLLDRKENRVKLGHYIVCVLHVDVYTMPTQWATVYNARSSERCM